MDYTTDCIILYRIIGYFKFWLLTINNSKLLWDVNFCTILYAHTSIYNICDFLLLNIQLLLTFSKLSWSINKGYFPLINCITGQ